MSDAKPPATDYVPRLTVTASERERTLAERVRFAYGETRLAILLVGPVVAVVWLFLRDQVEPQRIANWCIPPAAATARGC